MTLYNQSLLNFSHISGHFSQFISRWKHQVASTDLNVWVVLFGFPFLTAPGLKTTRTHLYLYLALGNVDSLFHRYHSLAKLNMAPSQIYIITHTSKHNCIHYTQAISFWQHNSRDNEKAQPLLFPFLLSLYVNNQWRWFIDDFLAKHLVNIVLKFIINSAANGRLHMISK